MSQEEGILFFVIMTLLIGALVLTIIKEGNKDERINKSDVIRVNQKRKRIKSGSEIPKNKVQSKGNFSYISKKKIKFKLKKDAGEN